MVEKKGKTGTRGSKQILEENVATKKFYQKMSIFSCAFFIIAAFLITTLNGTLITMSIIAFLIHGGANYFMDMMSRPTYVDDPGTDLNMEGGVAEHVKDTIILTAGTQLLSLLSNWFWFLLLLGPVRVFFMLWGSVIKPWMSQKSDKDENPQANDKKQKKLERRMKRVSSR